MELIMENTTEETKILEGQEAQAAVDAAAQQRAEDPFQVAAMVHSAYYGKFMEGIDQMTGKACKRILQYIVSYPFFPSPKATGSDEEALAQIADRLCEAKFLMMMTEMNKNLLQAQEQQSEQNEGENNG